MDDLAAVALRLSVSAAVAAAVAARSLRRGSVDSSAVFAGVPVMIVHMTAAYRYGLVLLVFFLTSSKATRFGEAKKKAMDAEFKPGGRRNWKQVLSNSAIATFLVCTIMVLTGGEDWCLNSKKSKTVTGLIGGFIGHYACSNGDTWSSEIGILSKAEPRLITTFKIVQRGTNGAITLVGLLAAAAAGFVIGVTFVILGFITAQCHPDIIWKQLLVIPVATAAGLCGSLIDSLLGATVQFSGFCTLQKKVVNKEGPTVSKISGMNMLDNNGVNVLSVLLTTLITGFACACIF